MEKVRIGFDLGGTNMGAALVSPTGEILYESDGPTHSHESPENIIGRMKGLIRNCLNEAKNLNLEVASIGIGCPGILDSNTGIIKFSPNLSHWNNVEIGRIMTEEFAVPVKIDNDVRVATLGEFNFGAGKGYQNIICITVGTGIGGGIILNGQLMRGPSQSMGEIGHMTLKKDGPLCGCGNHGCFESVASATAIIRKARNSIEDGKSPLMRKFTDEGEHISAYLVTKAAQQGDAEAVRIIRETAQWIGLGLANVINLLNPELVIIGGGVSLAGDILFKTIREEIAKRALKIPGSFVKVVPAMLGDSAGMIGASTLR
jgi:glucokinase